MDKVDLNQFAGVNYGTAKEAAATTRANAREARGSVSKQHGERIAARAAKNIPAHVAHAQRIREYQATQPNSMGKIISLANADHIERNGFPAVAE